MSEFINHDILPFLSGISFFNFDIKINYKLYSHEEKKCKLIIA